jgi:hypothetical protein
LKWEWVLLYFRIEEVNPSFTALFPISINIQFWIELSCNDTPLFGSVSSNKLNKFLIFFFDPIALLNRRGSSLVELINTLWVVSSWNEASYLNPIVFVKFVWILVLVIAVFSNGPLQEHCFLVSPIFLCVKWFDIWLARKFLEYFLSLLIISDKL